jgi:hypothetical protein
VRRPVIVTTDVNRRDTTASCARLTRAHVSHAVGAVALAVYSLESVFFFY